MPTWIDHDADGFVMGAQTTEGPYAPDPRPECEHEDAVWAAEGQVVRWAGGAFEVPRDDRAVWRLLRARGVVGEEYAEAMVRIRDVRGRFTQDLSPDVLVPIPPPRPECILPGLDAPFAGVPGLRWRAMSCLDLPAAAAAAIDGGLYLPTCPDGECSPPEAHAWLMIAARLDRPNTWQNVLTFQGRPLQYELITHGEDGATFSLTIHRARDRAGWFWPEAQAPVIRALEAQGIRRMRSFARKNRPDWVQALKDNYGAVQIAEREHTIHLEYPLAALAASAKGWPVRRAVGPITVGTVTVTEGTEADVPAVEALIDADLPPLRAAFVKRGLQERYHLDRATLLLSRVAGVLVDARMVRHRRDTTGSLFQLSRASKGPVLDPALAAGQAAWGTAAGYTRLTRFIPDSLIQNPDIQASLVATGARFVATRAQFKEPFHEWEVLL